MEWKEKPAWLKGGIIGGVIGVVSIILFLLVPTSLGLASFAQGIGALIRSLFGPVNGIWASIIINLIGYFIIGAIIGWIVGKIKSKKQEQMPIPQK